VVSSDSLGEKSAAVSRTEEIPVDPPQIWGPAEYLHTETVSPVKSENKEKNQFYLTVVELKPSVGRKLGDFWDLSALRQINNIGKYLAAQKLSGSALSYVLLCFHGCRLISLFPFLFNLEFM